MIAKFVAQGQQNPLTLLAIFALLAGCGTMENVADFSTAETAPESPIGSDIGGFPASSETPVESDSPFGTSDSSSGALPDTDVVGAGGGQDDPADGHEPEYLIDPLGIFASFFLDPKEPSATLGTLLIEIKAGAIRAQDGFGHFLPTLKICVGHQPERAVEIKLEDIQPDPASVDMNTISLELEGFHADRPIYLWGKTKSDCLSSAEAAGDWASIEIYSPDQER